MKRPVKIILQVFLGLILGLVVGASVGGFRNYSEEVGWYANGYLTLRGDYAYLQYKHADPQHGREALLTYLDALHWLEEKRSPVLRKQLAFDSGLTYLRLFRLEQASNNTANAEKFIKLAQAEFSSLGWKDVSEIRLQSSIETREANERTLDGIDGVLAATSVGPQSSGRKVGAP
jgi:hypothetical protein